MSESPVARLAALSMDCPEPQRLADFYLGLLGGRQLWARDGSIGLDISGLAVVLQRVEPYSPPTWPDSSIVHLDLTSGDIAAAAKRALELGATEPAQSDPRWRVLLDPAGHPFCLTPFTPDLSS